MLPPLVPLDGEPGDLRPEPETDRVLVPVFGETPKPAAIPGVLAPTPPAEALKPFDQ